MSVLSMIISQIKIMIIPCLIALPIIFLFRFYSYKKSGEINKKHEAIIALFWLYIVAVLSVTVIPESVAAGDFSTFPFNKPDFSTITSVKETIGWVQWKIYLKDYADIAKNIFGNVLVFIPFSLLFPLAYKEKYKLAVPIGILFSFIIEFCQLFSPRQADYIDIMLNTIGILIGFIFYLIIRKARR